MKVLGGLSVIVRGIVLSVLIISTGLAKPTPELLKEARKLYELGRYYEAIQFYEKALSQNNGLSEAHYYVGSCYRYLFQYELALLHYQNIPASEFSAYPLLNIDLGLVNKSLGNYRVAKKYLRTFIQDASALNIENRTYWLEKAKTELSGLAVIHQPPYTPILNAQIVKLPYPINTDSHDMAAVPYYGADTIIVTTTRSVSRGVQYHDQHGESYSDNFLFIKEEGQWEERSRLHRFSSINSASDDGPGMLSHDRQTYYFTKYTETGDYHIFESDFKESHWEKPEPLPIPINLPGYISKHPAISVTGDTLFFSSNRPGGLGDSDLWMSVRHRDEWQHPINLGPTINTPNHETSPHWDAQSQTLFFASNGHVGWGGFDLYSAVILPDDLPNRVINLGKPINSSKDETYLWVGKNRGYLTSNREGKMGSFDVYEYSYEDEPKLLLSLTTHSLWDEWVDQLASETNDELALNNHQFFSSLPTQEQAAMQRAARQRIFQALMSEDDMTPAFMDEAQSWFHLNENKIHQMVADQLAFYLSFRVPDWSDETRQWYTSLNHEEQRQLERTVKLLVVQTLLEQNGGASSVASYRYEELSSEQRTWVDRAVDRGVQYFREVKNDLIGLEAMQQWQILSAEEKDQLGQELTYRYFQSFLSQDDALSDLGFHFEQLPSDKQQQINRLAHSLILQGKASSNVELNESSLLLETLSAEEKRELIKLIVYRAGELKDKSLPESSSVDARKWEELPLDEHQRMKRALTTRRFAQRLKSNLATPKPLHQQQINLHALLQVNPDVVTVRGRVRHPANSSVEVSLGSENNLLRVNTDSSGQFVFERVSYRNSPQIFLGNSDSTQDKMLSLQLQELEITVDQDSVFNERFDHIYFGTGKFTIDQEAEPVLDRVRNFHQLHPDVSIQIHAFADSVGDSSYNYHLSERRSESVIQALIKSGVNSNVLVSVPRGKEDRSPSKELSYSRRAEFKISGSNTTYNPTREIFLLTSDPDLTRIAKKYRVSVDRLVADNPGLDDASSAYTIIKITPNSLKYDE